jgi:hypothetical protein
MLTLTFPGYDWEAADDEAVATALELMEEMGQE